MKKLLLLAVVLCSALHLSQAQSADEKKVLEAKIKDAAKAQYPNNPDMQQHQVETQLAAYKYMASVADTQIKKLAELEAGEDYSMQKYIYDKQLNGKLFMQSTDDDDVNRPVPLESAGALEIRLNQGAVAHGNLTVENVDSRPASGVPLLPS